MKYFGIVLLAITVTSIGFQQNFANSQTPRCDQSQTACAASCNESQGCKTCRLHVETLKVKKYCFTIECKDICIPPVRFPWQKCCELKCGKIKTVRVLKKHNYTCEKCGYKWTVDCQCGSCSPVNCVTAIQKPIPVFTPAPTTAPAPASTYAPAPAPTSARRLPRTTSVRK
ncbi:MAG: hypothetical protein QM501_05070 [Gimesia sp.]